MITIYKERANGQDELFLYADGRRIRVSHAWIMREERHGERVRIVDLHDRDLRNQMARR